MKRRVAVASLVAVALSAAVVASAPSASATRQPVLIDGFGRWTLARLHASELDLMPALPRAAVSYSLPPGAKQGPHDWYLIELHFRLTLPRRRQPGLLYVSASTRRRAAAQIKFGIARDAAGRTRTSWSTVDYIHGRLQHIAYGRTIEVRFENYLQFAGVRGGRNRLRVNVERYAGATFERVRVFRDSGIVFAPVSPAHLKLQLSLPDGKVHAGDKFAIGFHLRNTGDRAARNVVLGTSYPRGALRSLGATRRFSVLDRSASGSLRFEALRPGVFRLALYARSSTNQPGALVEVPVGAADSSGVWRLVGRGAGGAAIVVAAALLLLGRRRILGGLLLALTLMAAGCGGGNGDVRKNKQILATLPRPRAAHQIELKSAPIYREDSGNGDVIGQTTRIDYRMPNGTKPNYVAAFYRARLRRGWRCASNEETGPRGPIVILNCRKGASLISVNTESMYGSPPQYEIAIDHSGAARGA